MFHKKTRYLCIIMSVILLSGLLVGCSASTNNSTANQAESKTSSTQQEEIKQSATAPQSDNQTKPSNTKEPTKVPTPKYTINDEVIVDNDDCTFKIVKAEDSSWGFTLKTYCENKTADKTLMFTTNQVCVNGYMIDPFWAKEVVAGKKANSEITFNSSDLKEIGISSPDEIIFELRVYNSDDWNADDFVKGVFTVYPTGKNPDEIVYPERKTTSDEKVFFDDDRITFVILNTKEDDIWGCTLNCYLENKTDKTLMFTWEDVSVNGFMIDPFWAREIPSGKRCYSGISFSKTGFEENNITKVEIIESTMRVYDSNNWLADNILNETITYEP